MRSIGELTTIGTSLARPVIARAQIDIAKVGLPYRCRGELITKYRNTEGGRHRCFSRLHW